MLLNHKDVIFHRKRISANKSTTVSGRDGLKRGQVFRERGDRNEAKGTEAVVGLF